MLKKYLLLGCLVVLLAGCAQCLLMRSEYYDITGKVYTPKPADKEILVVTGVSEKPYQDIGVVTVLARYGTTHEALIEEMKRRARDAGADALMEIKYGEDATNKDKLCGRWFSTKRNASATAKAIVFTPLEKEADKTIAGK